MNTPSTRALAITALIGVVIIGLVTLSNAGGSSQAAAASDSIGGTGGSTGSGGIISSIGAFFSGNHTQVVQNNPGGPLVPTNLRLSYVTNYSVKLTWDSSAAYFDVYRNGVYLGTTYRQSFYDFTVVSGASYSYTVDAFDTVGDHSAQSNGVSVTVKAKGALPVAVANLTATSIGDEDMTLTWATTSEPQGVSDIAIYQIIDGVPVPFGDIENNDTWYDVQRLESGTQYQFALQVTDKAGNTSPFATVTATTTGQPDNQCQLAAGSPVFAGGSTWLSWTGVGRLQVPTLASASTTIDNGIGIVTPATGGNNGYKINTGPLNQTTTFTATMMNAGVPIRCQTTVRVLPASDY